MKTKWSALFLFFLVASLAGTQMIVDPGVRQEVKAALLQKFGKDLSLRIERGVDQAAAFWRAEDGTAGEFKQFCLDHFIPDGNHLATIVGRIETNFEVLFGHFNKISLDLRRPLDLALGDILPIDNLFGQYAPGAHLSDDFFANRLAFDVMLNFPYYSLAEKTSLGEKWSREDWARARIGDVFISRIPAVVQQKIVAAFTEAGTYVDEYNICLDRLLDAKGNPSFPAGLKLISHWGIRDEIKARYADKQGLPKQRMITAVMRRIIDQSIPVAVINNPTPTWNPVTNAVTLDGKTLAANPEPDTRYRHILKIFQAKSAVDPYFPVMPTSIQRKFEMDREIPEKDVEDLFIRLVSSPLVKQTAKLIEKRLRRKLEPFDIWYNGFRSNSAIPAEELDRICRAKYPNAAAMERDMPDILVKLGFSREKAVWISEKIAIDPARGPGGAWGAQMKSEKAHLRTRIAPEGMDYKGFNIAMHEFGHCVEQTLTLQDVDHYMLTGVPNTAFTEAFAFIFQEQDMKILGFEKKDEQAASLKALDSLWNSYEIMGVSLVEMKIWNWLYRHPAATADELKSAMSEIACQVWNAYYAPVFGIRDQPLLAIYSHMVMDPLYLADYPLGHLIEFQMSQYLEGKPIGPEMERMCRAGRVVPQLWMKLAVGSPIAVEPLLSAAARALKVIR